MVFWFHKSFCAFRFKATLKGSPYIQSPRLRSSQREGGPYGCLRLLHRRADEVAPLGPRAVVVLHVLESEEILHGEPGEAGPFADAAVRDDGLVPQDALRGIQRLQFVEALEGAVLVAVLSPRDALGTGNMAAPLARLGQPRRRENLAREFGRASHVDERRLLAREGPLHFRQERTQRQIGRARFLRFGLD